jgi:hypothetical protein
MLTPFHKNHRYLAQALRETESSPATAIIKCVVHPAAEALLGKRFWL